MPDPEKVNASSETGDINPKPDPPALAEVDIAKHQAELKTLQLQNDRLEEDLRGLKNDNQARVNYANRIFCMIAVWLVAIFVILLCQGFFARGETILGWLVPGPYGAFTVGPMHFDLSDEVILALIGSTTASVLGVFIFVAKYLFPERKT